MSSVGDGWRMVGRTDVVLNYPTARPANPSLIALRFAQHPDRAESALDC